MIQIQSEWGRDDIAILAQLHSENGSLIVFNKIVELFTAYQLKENGDFTFRTHGRLQRSSAPWMFSFEEQVGDFSFQTHFEMWTFETHIGTFSFQTHFEILVSKNIRETSAFERTDFWHIESSWTTIESKLAPETWI